VIDTLIDWNNKPVILASASPRRKQILSLAGIDFTVHPSNYHEPDDENAKPWIYPAITQTPGSLGQIQLLLKTGKFWKNPLTEQMRSTC